MTLLCDNRALLKAFRDGEEAALSQVYLAYSGEVARVLAGFAVRSSPGQRRLGPLDVEVALQLTFERAFAPPARLAYDGLRPYAPWLLSLARIAAIDTMRQAAKGSAELGQSGSEGADEAAGIPDGALDPEEEALSAELKAIVRGFLASLPGPDCALARARFEDGLSQEAAAAALGLTRAQLRRKEQKVRQAFSDHLLATGYLAGPDPVRLAATAMLLLAL